MNKYFVSLRKYNKLNENNYNKENFPSEYGELVKSFTLKDNALFYIEEFIVDYIKENQGELKFDFYSEHPSANELKYGFYVIYYKDSVFKYTVYERKRIVGYLINTYQNIKHFDISLEHLTEPKRSFFNNEHIDYVSQLFEYEAEKEDYLDELKDVFSKLTSEDKLKSERLM